MSGWVPMPREALALCHGPLERSAVLDLYERAHTLRWRPLRVTERSLCTAWGMGNTRVWSLLDQLVAAGLIEMEKGGKRHPTTIVVLSPLAEASQNARHEDQRSDQQNDAPPTPDIAECTAQDTAPNTATLNEILEREEDNTESVEGADPSRVAFERLAKAWVDKHPGGPKPNPKRGQGQLLMARIREHGEESVTRVLRWAHHSPHDRADFLRRRGLSLKTLMQASNFEEYLGFAAEERPRSVVTPATGPPTLVAVTIERKERLREAIRERRRDDGAE